MLSPEEFAVGTFAAAKPSSLVLPRTKYEAMALICEGDGEPVALFLGGDHIFHSFPCSKADNWQGLIVPQIRIEVDESSLYIPDYNDHGLGIVIRRDNNLLVRCRGERSYGRPITVVIRSGLPASVGEAAFTKWQIVIGKGEERRVLHKVDIGEPPKG